MDGLLGLDREELLDSAVSVVALSIIVLLTLLFVAYNPWGWRNPLLIAIVFGLHLVPILTLVPVTYLLVKVVSEASEGRSETATTVTSWIGPTGSNDDAQSRERSPPESPEARTDDRS